MYLLLNELGKLLASIGVVVFCVFLFVGTYLLNKKTKKPEGCQDMSEYCEGCSLTSCSHHPNNQPEEKEDKKEGEKEND